MINSHLEMKYEITNKYKQLSKKVAGLCVYFLQGLNYHITQTLYTCK